MNNLFVVARHITELVLTNATTELWKVDEIIRHIK